ncbi:MAG: regulatory iron-sulfur-containing complex subunit RicT [Anaerolineaceae bacterium]|jgi:cell fate regulator YaaT (PSP1 superfamily)
MTETSTPNTPFIVGVRFSRIGKIYHFDASKLDGLRVGDTVVVETSRGWQLGEVARIIQTPPPPPDGSWKAIDRRATPLDLVQKQSWQKKEPDVVSACRQRAKELRLNDVKIVTAEYSFEGSRLTILFNSDSEDKIDLKSLRQDMQRMFTPTQVEMRQVGPRDVAKFMCGMGACGLEMRCCSQFITEFSSISIKMAKEQGISLTPTEITGMCGRLRCCLIYEFEQYVEARKQLPKRNKRVITPQGVGRVLDVYPLRGGVLVELPELGAREFTKEEIQPADELEALQAKAQSPCPDPNNPNCVENQSGKLNNDAKTGEMD